MSKTFKCAKCRRETDTLERFPKDLCVNCHEAVMDKVAVEDLPKPDFVAAIKQKDL